MTVILIHDIKNHPFVKSFSNENELVKVAPPKEEKENTDPCKKPGIKQEYLNHLQKQLEKEKKEILEITTDEIEKLQWEADFAVKQKRLNDLQEENFKPEEAIGFMNFAYAKHAKQNPITIAQVDKLKKDYETCEIALDLKKLGEAEKHLKNKLEKIQTADDLKIGSFDAKPLKSNIANLFEIKIMGQHKPLRIYFTFAENSKDIILLGMGEKNSQKKDIANCEKLYKEILDTKQQPKLLKVAFKFGKVA
jgi:putative component of toxin-antitoxin plasmid stabilization module